MANDFKSLFMLDPEVTYFNHGAYGGCPEYIFNAMMAKDIGKKSKQIFGRII